MKLRVWWKTSGKSIKYYYVKDLDEAAFVITVLAIREVDDDDSIGYNESGVEMYDDIDNEWCDYYDEDGYSFDDLKNEYMDWFFGKIKG